MTNEPQPAVVLPASGPSCHIPDLEFIILNNMFYDVLIASKVCSVIDYKLFENPVYQIIYQCFRDFVFQHGRLPTPTIIKIEAEKNPKFSDAEIKTVIDTLVLFSPTYVEPNKDWLEKSAEIHFKTRAAYMAVMEAVDIIDDKNAPSKAAILPIMEDALKICFDTTIGQELIEDASDRFDRYQHSATKYPFDLDFFNKITKGGLHEKTLNVILAATGVGKSALLCHMAAHQATLGRNVLYITCEMAEDSILQRIEANILDMEMSAIPQMDKNVYIQRFNTLRAKSPGKLIVKEFPTGTGDAHQVRSLLKDLELKQNIKIDFLVVDYLNLLKPISDKIPASKSYIYVKTVAEELRSVAQAWPLVCLTATQTNRSGYNNLDLTLDQVSESFAVSSTADLFFAMMTSDELREKGQMLIKQLKNRYADDVIYRKFLIGFDRLKMRFYDIAPENQTLVDDDDDDDDTFQQTPTTSFTWPKASTQAPQTPPNKDEVDWSSNLKNRRKQVVMGMKGDLANETPN